MPSAGALESKFANIAVVVTHGVGEAEPGECSSALVRALGKEPGVAVEEAAEVMLLPDKATGAKQPEQGHPKSSSAVAPGATFPVLLRYATIQDRFRLTFAELHWADLTRIGTGRIASMLGLFRVIFEAHYVIDAMLRGRSGWAVRGLRITLLWLSWLMRGPIAGVTAVTAAVLWAALYLRPQGLLGQWQPRYVFAGVVAVVFLLALALRIWSETRWDTSWRTSLNWTLMISALFSGVFLTAPSPLTSALYHPLNFALTVWRALAPSLFAHYSALNPTVSTFPAFAQRADFVNILYHNLIRLWIAFGTVWLLGALTMLSAIGIFAWRRTALRALFAPALAATGILTLQFTLWTALVGTAVLPLLNRAQEIIAITAVKAAVTDPSLRNFEEVDRLLDVAHFSKVHYDWVPRLIFAYGFNGIIVILVVFAGACVFYTRRRMAARAKGASKDVLAATAKRLPRVLFSWPVIAVLMTLTLVQVMFNIMFAAETQKNAFARATLDVLAYFVNADLITELKQTADHVFASYVNVTMLLAWSLALAFPLLMGKGLNNAVHIARDLIDHQYGPHRGSILAQRRDRRLLDRLRFPRRERIRQRLLQLLGVLAQRGGYERIIFLAHSQGSVVIFDYLKDAVDQNSRALSTGRPDFITFGSPLGHLYQFYFPEYEGLEPSLERLHQSVGRWINLYRIDDYIGSWLGKLDGGSVDNRPMEPGGHIDYWKEGDVAKAILEIVAMSQETTSAATVA